MNKRRHIAWTAGALVALATAFGAAMAAEGETSAASGDPALAAIDRFIAEKKIDTKSDGWKQRLPKPPKVEFAPDKVYYWELKTNKGDLVFQLLHKTAPMHVSSAIYLTQLGYYDGTPFHRVIKKFMAQGGDPTGTGRGGPGYNYAGEFDGSVKHDKRGTLSMANAGPNTDGSQFFITFAPTPFLDGKHTVWGKLRGGEKTLEELEKRGAEGEGSPSEKLEIVKASIRVE
jgi:peptidyl-prolyl cis-trans isomerase B (cyclophilin B)